ncbi:hypothetical protein ACRAVF_33935 (plasmid) [Bradyrhizobium oligotrophicum S58]
MKPPGKTTLNRMMLTAQRIQEEIEGSQRARMLAALIAAPQPDQVERRDDCAGIVRLIDAIQHDRQLFELLRRAMERRNCMTIEDIAPLRDPEVDAE